MLSLFKYGFKFAKIIDKVGCTALSLTSLCNQLFPNIFANNSTHYLLWGNLTRLHTAQRCQWHRCAKMTPLWLWPSYSRGSGLGWSTKFYFVFREIIFFISRNFVSRNITKFREIFVTKLKFSQVKIHFWILLHFNTTKKITLMSKIHKHVYISISVFSGTDPMIRICAKISRIRNTGKNFNKCWLKFILYVLNSKNLHNKTISRNNLHEISRNALVFEKIT
jgi:hypothetical protein